MSETRNFVLKMELVSSKLGFMGLHQVCMCFRDLNVSFRSQDELLTYKSYFLDFRMGFWDPNLTFKASEWRFGTQTLIFNPNVTPKPEFSLSDKHKLGISLYFCLFCHHLKYNQLKLFCSTCCFIITPTYTPTHTDTKDILLIVTVYFCMRNVWYDNV